MIKDFKEYLNPIINKIDQIEDFSDVVAENELEESEFKYHQKTINLIISDVRTGLVQMERLREQLEHFIWIIDNETGDDKTDAIKEYNKLLVQMEDLVDRINRSLDILDESYFGKIIFHRKSSGALPSKEIPVYIGKFAYFDKTTNTPLISDWRAPISNLYYKYSGPIEGVSFRSPAGEQNGNILQKRQFEIGSGRIQNIYDITSGNTATDQFLLKQLDQRIGKKLKEIVSTIQSQQNEIIRDRINKPMLIQGVAGSGKTTIILHRLAYLFYTYPDKIRPEHSLIIAPNQMFIDYIADVLPSLGVKGLSQNTFLLWAREKLLLNDKFVLHNEEENQVKKLKGSWEYKTLIEKYIEYFEEKFFEDMPSLMNEEIEEEYKILKGKNPQLPMREQVNLAVDAVFVHRKIARKGKVIDTSKMNMEIKRTEEVKKYIRNTLNVYGVYRSLFKYDVEELSNFTKNEWDLISTQSVKGFNREKGFKGYSENDLAAMLIIHKYLDGTNEDLYDYVIIDEAQDLSPIQIYSILSFSKNNNLTLAGDTAQAIVPPYYIVDWDGIIKAISDEIGEDLIFHNLKRSYRSTIEIIEFANEILRGSFPETYQLPEAVLRHGEKVEVIGTKDKQLIKIIKEEIEKERSSIALITRNEKEADQLVERLQSEDFKYQIFSYHDEDFHSGIQVLPVKYAKGLEFDCVILISITNENYSSDDEARLLYVGMTRALHKLYLQIDSMDRSKLIPEKLLNL